MSTSPALQKLSRRVAQAERRIKLRHAKKKLKADIQESQGIWQFMKMTRGKVTKEVVNARQWRREDWELGDLAPMRHSNPKFGMGAIRTATMLTAQHYVYGKGRYHLPTTGKPFRSEHDPVHLKKTGWTALPLDEEDIARRKKQYKEFMVKEKWRYLPEELKEKSKRFDGQDSYWLRPNFVREDNIFYPGDTVVMTRGPQAGQISTVQRVTERGDGATVEGINEFEYKTKHWLIVSQQLDSPVQIVNRPVNNRYLRLILVPGKHLPEDQKHVILEKMVLKRYWRPMSGTYSDIERRIPGLNQVLKDPAKMRKKSDNSSEDDDVGEAYDDDTLRITTEEVTFTPPMINLPMPEGVIDELRGKYSRFRTRHTPEYIAKQEAKEAAAQEKITSADSMRGPVKELNERIRQQVQREWSKRAEKDGSLAAIGEAIFKLKIAEQGKEASGQTTA